MFEHCLVNGFQAFFTSGDVGAHTESLQPLDDISSSSEDEDRRRRASDDNFRGVGTANGSSCINI